MFLLYGNRIYIYMRTYLLISLFIFVCLCIYLFIYYNSNLDGPRKNISWSIMITGLYCQT